MSDNTFIKNTPSGVGGAAGSILIDIGNSTICIAHATDDGKIKDIWRLKTLKDETISFFRHEIRIGIRSFGLLNADGSVTGISSVTISSVVPEINDKISQAVFDITGIKPHFFSLSDAKKHIGIDIEVPSQLGKDRLADAIGAVTTYGYPCIVLDMGTATTIGVVNEKRDFIGGMIMPGVKTSLKALSSKASQLPTINIEVPQHMIGRNTLECMQSGILYGTAAMMDGLIDRILPTLPDNTKIIATGGMSSQIIPFCKHDITIDEHLQFKGILAVNPK